MKRIILLFILLFCVIKGSAKQDTIFINKVQEQINIGNLDSAYYMLSSIIHNNDSLFNMEYNGNINSFYNQYTIDEKILQNEKARNKILFLLMLFFICIVVALYLAFIFYKKNTTLLQKEEESLKEATLLIENSLQNKNIFLSNMSHEIRTPLNALVGFSSLLADGIIETNSPQAKQFNEIIKLNADLLLKLINDVVDVSTLDVNNMCFNLHKTDVVELSSRTIETMLQINMSSSNIVFDCNLQTLYINTDAVRLQQVIINLINNAIKFCDNGLITLSLKQIGDNVEFSVTDTGVGIPSDQRDKLFKRFSKLNEDKMGTGLGLSICKLIIKRMGGDIWLDTNYMQGARFVFNHPINPKGVTL